MSRAVWVTRKQWHTVEQYYGLSECQNGSHPIGYITEHDWRRNYNGFRLKPGDGPVRVKIEVKRVK